MGRMKVLSALLFLCAVGTSCAQENRSRHVTEILRDIFGLPGVWDLDISEIVTKDDEGYVFNEAITNFIDDRIIPELCELTSNKINILNSYFLDPICLRELESVGPRCKEFKCKLAQYVKENGPRIVHTLFYKESPLGSLREAAKFLGKELSAVFKETEMCTCGKKFIKAASKCAPSYYGNAMFEDMGGESYGLVNFATAMRNIDFDAASKAATLLMDHLCEETSSGKCIDSIVEVAAKAGDFYETTFIYDTYNAYEAIQSGDEEAMIDIMKKCDNLLYFYVHSFEKPTEKPFDKYAMHAKNFYCDEYCKEGRGNFYPCCMRKMFGDKKMWDNVAKVIESIYKMGELLDELSWQRENGEIYSYYMSEEDRQQYDWLMKWKVPKEQREGFLKFIGAANYCEGGKVECIEF